MSFKVLTKKQKLAAAAERPENFFLPFSDDFRSNRKLRKSAAAERPIEVVDVDDGGATCRRRQTPTSRKRSPQTSLHATAAATTTTTTTTATTSGDLSESDISDPKPEEPPGGRESLRESLHVFAAEQNNQSAHSARCPAGCQHSRRSRGKQKIISSH